MRESNLVGTWKYLGKDVTDRFGEDTGRFTFDLSGKFTQVFDNPGLFGTLFSIAIGNIVEGTWRLNEDGTKISLDYRAINGKLGLHKISVGNFFIAFARFFAKDWREITEIDSDHLDITDWSLERM